LVPQKLKPEQKETRMSISGDFINMADRDKKYLNNTITGDEIWCFLYDLQTMANSEYKSSSSL
jgi:hypothetical protein